MYERPLRQERINNTAVLVDFILIFVHAMKAFQDAQHERNTDDYYFKDEATSKLVELSGQCVIIQI